MKFDQEALKSLEEKGFIKRMEAPFKECPSCRGLGTKFYTKPPEHCETCNGTGRVYVLPDHLRMDKHIDERIVFIALLVTAFLMLGYFLLKGLL